MQSSKSKSKTITFVIGGVRSGKSRLAQRMGAGRGSVVFVATATASDPEMEQRIERHRQSRPSSWQTLEVPFDLDVAIEGFQDANQLVVIDCLTVYLANVMSAAKGNESVIRDRMERMCSALEKTSTSIIIVSNEVGSGVHAPTATGRLYCDLLGELNQRVAALADNVILMVAGIAIAVKGSLEALQDLEFEREDIEAARH